MPQYFVNTNLYYHSTICLPQYTQGLKYLVAFRNMKAKELGSKFRGASIKAKIGLGQEDQL